MLVALALGAPAGARASTHLWLSARSNQLTPARLGGWEVKIDATSDDNYSEAGAADHASLGATLHLKRPRFDEFHGYGPAETGELSFDGVAGRLRVDSSSNSALAADLRIEATGMPAPYLADACPGAPMLQVPVRLVGTLTVRTGTRFFATVGAGTLSGTMLYNDGPPGPCYPTPNGPPRICGHGRTLYANDDAPPFVLVRWESRSIYRYASIVFGDPKQPGWGHALQVPLLRNPFSGRLGSLRAAIGPRGPLRGFVRFHLLTRKQDTADPHCAGPPVTRAQGTLTGRFVAAFHGWGTRALVLRRVLGFVVVE